MKFIIDRKTWLRGSPNSYLLDTHGKKCCLGFFSLACGLSEADIEGLPNPGDVKNTGKFPTWLIENSNHTDCCNSLINANDSSIFTEEYREDRIIKIFVDHGVEVEFVN